MVAWIALAWLVGTALGGVMDRNDQVPVPDDSHVSA